MKLNEHNHNSDHSFIYFQVEQIRNFKIILEKSETNPKLNIENNYFKYTTSKTKNLAEAQFTKGHLTPNGDFNQAKQRVITVNTAFACIHRVQYFSFVSFKMTLFSNYQHTRHYLKQESESACY